jgi:hypothetical protein
MTGHSWRVLGFEHLGEPSQGIKLPGPSTRQGRPLGRRP